ncbi:hypothetical protein T4B_8707 [Trichinella pseudospiralis]|uniref:Uncharacterized protein n=1 Tax=Trichinella pseudospiralis TaxID=6337 RepID=A0A0V1IB82_TRIPS|nr:hypothetical protein T4B_8707 [Trichinella pseudospiralis]
MDDTKQIADDTKQIADDTKQMCGMKTYGICGSPRVPILIARMDRLDRIVRWSVAFVGQIVVSIGTLEKIRFTEVERERFFITKTQ